MVLGSAGAAFANVLYCEPGTLVIEIQPAGMENQWVRNICLQNGCRFVAYFCDAEAADPQKPEVSLRFDIDTDRFMDTVRAFPPLDRHTAEPAGWRSVLRELKGLFRSDR